MSIALVALGLIAAFVVYLKLMEKRMIYFPARALDWSPSENKIAFQELRLLCSDGITIHGWFIPAGKPRATVLFLHGNAGNISHRAEKILLLRGLDLNVCIVDYHGYGQSEGTPSEKATYLDAEAAYDWLTNQQGIAPKQLLVWGESLGGGVATYLALERPVGGLVLESTYTSLPDVGRAVFPFLPTKLLMETRYDSLGRMRRIRVPVLSLHSPHDEVVPYRLGKRLFQAANEPKTFVDLKGDHNGGFLLSGDVYTNGIRAYLDRHFQ